MIINLCSIEKCNKKEYENKYCKEHYLQIYKYGEIINQPKLRTIQTPNEIIIKGNICYMKLYNNKCIEVAETIFDLKYKEEVEKYKWHIDKYNYVVTISLDDTYPQLIFLHQLILYLSNKIINYDQETDHKDTNKLNNLDTNLRVCSSLQNKYNKNKYITNISGYKGVSWHKPLKKWVSHICVNYKIIHLGYFNIKEDAARAYNIAATKHFGEFAVLNNV